VHKKQFPYNYNVWTKSPDNRKLNNNLSKVDIQSRKLRELGFDETNLGCFSLSFKLTNYTDKKGKVKRRKPLSAVTGRRAEIRKKTAEFIFNC
jgi:hypothetical protein